MNQSWDRPSTEVRLSVTLSPTSTCIGGPGIIKEGFVNHQPTARLPNSANGRSFFADAGEANPTEARRRLRNVATARIRRWGVDTGIPSRGPPRGRPPNKSIGLTSPLVGAV